MRPTRRVVDLDALCENYLFARSVHGGRALAVVKADAYGHGALACARALESVADGLAVAFLDEAVALCEGGICSPILILEGVFSPAELRVAVNLGLWLVIHHDEQIRMLEKSGPVPAGVNVWLKIDSGMRRAGFAPEEASRAYDRLMQTGKVRSITLMTHFACADEPDDPMTRRQIECFDRATAALPGPRSLCNSAGLLWWPEARKDWGRPGIMLYGAEPGGRSVPELRPVMTFESRIFAVRTLEAGDSLGYGASYTAPSRKRIGLVCAGYADGYPQSAPNGTPVAVDGQRTVLLGRVSMDMLTVDLTDLPDADVGSTVELWGRTIRVNVVAAAAGRSVYELLCGTKRAPVEHRSDRAAGKQSRTTPSALSSGLAGRAAERIASG